MCIRTSPVLTLSLWLLSNLVFIRLQVASASIFDGSGFRGAITEVAAMVAGKRGVLVDRGNRDLVKPT
jgi:hypothetical protein